MKLLSSLVGVVLSLSAGIENSQKMYDVQKTKTVRQKSTQQLERIQKKITEVRGISPGSMKEFRGFLFFVCVNESNSNDCGVLLPF